MKFKVTDRQIVRVDETTSVTSGSVGIDEAVFEFSADWDGLDKSAVFESNGVAVTCRLKAGDPAVRIPPEVLATPLESLRVGVFGLRGTEIVKPTTWCTAISVILPGVPTNAPGSVPPTPSVYQQWVSDIRADATQVAADAARVDTDKKAVAADRQAVDQLASGFGDTVQAAGTAIVLSGGQQVKVVQTAGTDAVAAVAQNVAAASQSADDAAQSATQAAGHAGDADADAAAAAQAKSAAQQALTDLLAMLGTDIASLVGGKIPMSQIPATATQEIYTVASAAELTGLIAQRGDLSELVELVDGVRTVTKTWQMLGDDATVLANWIPWGTSYAVQAGNAATAKNADNADKINNHRLVEMSAEEYATGVKDPDTYYIVWG